MSVPLGLEPTARASSAASPDIHREEIPRRGPGRALGAVLGLLWMVGCSASQESGGEVERQISELARSETPLNVVLVTIDTLRADRLSSYGSDVQTPRLDRLAEEGVLFSNASTTVPFTFPAHSSIMTGTYPPFHGVRENVGYYLGEENRTLAEMLSEAGWETAGFISAFVLDSRWGIARGFDHYFDDFELGAFESSNLGSVQRPGNETIAEAVRWLDGRADPERPFFLWLHLFDPHDPYTPPEPYRSQYRGRPYDAEVAYTDSLIGGFVDALDERGLMESTAMVLTSDHGEGLGDHGETFHGYFIYDSTVHVPLIIRLPDGAAAGGRVGSAVSHVDIAPTILELTGIARPEPLQGRSLLPAMADPTAEDGVEVYAESFYPLLHYGWAPLRALRGNRYKLIEAPTPELFDLSSDPGETSNLYDSAQEGRAMSRALLALGERLEEGAPETASADLDEQTLAQLRTLGYMAGPGEADARSYDPTVPRTDPKETIHLHRSIMRAQGLIGDGEVAEAETILREALSEDENLIDVHQMLGSLELDAGDPDAALGYFERALSLDDRHTPSLFGMATAHRDLGRLDDALLGFRRLLDVAGQDSKATLAIADIEVDRGGLAAAETVLAAAAEPGAPALIFNRLGEVRALGGRADEAMEAFQAAIEANPDLSEPHFNRAVLLEARGDFSGARAAYQDAIERAPKHYQAQFNLARLLGRGGDAGAERELLERSIESKPDFAIGYFFLGKALMDSGDLLRAEEVTRAGLEIRQDNAFGWAVLADILNRTGRRREAGEALETARELGSGS